MAFEWPLGKLELINSALSQTSDNLVATADDGSEEWNAASPAYERALALQEDLVRHNSANNEYVNDLAWTLSVLSELLIDKGNLDTQVASHHVAEVHIPGDMSSLYRRRAHRITVVRSTQCCRHRVVQILAAIGTQQAERIGADVDAGFIC